MCPVSASSVCVMELYVLDIQCVLGGGSVTSVSSVHMVT